MFIKVNTNEKSNFYGSRFSAQPLRLEIESALDQHQKIELDFQNVQGVTQSYIDELIGALILQYGPNLLKRINFKNCTDLVEAVIRVVVENRAADYSSHPQH